MLKPTQPLMLRVRRKLALSTKSAAIGTGYYKGNRTGSMGWHTKHGNYKIDWTKVRTYVAPSGLDKCMLTPFVSEQVEKPKKSNKLASQWGGKINGESYLGLWKIMNGKS